MYLFLLETLDLPVNVPDWMRWTITFAVILLLAYNTYRSRTNKVLIEELDIQRNKNNRLEDDLKENVDEKHKLECELSEYKAKTDLTALTLQQQKNHDATLTELARISAALVSQGQILAPMAKLMEKLMEKLGGMPNR